jgi:probable F420-dependent oxidoreductase
MIIDAILPPAPLSEIPSIARAAETIGFHTIWSSETVHDPFLPGALIAEHTKKLNFGTAIAVAFARNPATLAYTAWDLSQASGGRFILGLGTQVKAHIERRFGMAWPNSPVNQLREEIEAIHAIWRAWQSGEPLNFRGEFYKLTLMSPFFNPGPIPNPDIPIYIAGVNTGLARLSGEVAEGFLVHPFHTPRYLRDVLLPAIQKGLEKSGRSRADIKIAVTAFIISQPEEVSFVRQQIAFYASTPSYRPVMAHHGWEQVAEKLSSLAAHGQWTEMPALIDDNMLAEFAVRAEGTDLPAVLNDRYCELADRLSLYSPFIPGERNTFWQTIINGID